MNKIRILMRVTISSIIVIIRLNPTECVLNDLIGKQTAVNISNYNTSHGSPPRLTRDTNGPWTFVAVYDGAVARLHCPASKVKASWMYAKSLNNLTFTPVVQKDRVLVQNDSISIYRTTPEDAGVYSCQTELRGLVVLEVVEDGYIEVQHSNTPRPSSQSTGQELSIFYVWSDWSECSTCGEEGRRRRCGMCYVKLNNLTRSGKKNHHNMSSRSFTILEAFSGGIPCRSRLLPEVIRNMPAVRDTKNDIIITTCKVQCKVKIFEIRSPSGDILETANNSAGVYSLKQPLPPQPPAPARDILFVGRGQRVLVMCTGTTLRDIPVTWRAGNYPVEPEALRGSSGGRVYVDARDRIVITHVLYEDGNLYSCWEGGNLAGTVKLVVWAGAQERWNHRSEPAAAGLPGAVLSKASMGMP